MRKFFAGLALFCALAAALPAQSSELAWPDRLSVVYIPAEGRQKTLDRYREFSAYLGATLGLQVVPVSFDNYQQMLAHLITGQFDLAYLSPSTYGEAGHWLDLQVLATELDLQGGRGYHSLIITRPDTGIAGIENLAGRTFAFTDPESTTGFLVPLAHFLADLQATPAMLAEKVVFARDHRAVVQGVLEGKYDAGTVSSAHLLRILRDERRSPADVKVIWQSELLPGLPVCARPDLHPGLVAAVQVALLNFGNDPGRVSRLGIGGFGPARAADYDYVLRLEGYQP